MIFNYLEKISFNSIKRQIINWLEMDYVPIGLNKNEMVIFENKIDEWVKV